MRVLSIFRDSFETTVLSLSETFQAATKTTFDILAECRNIHHSGDCELSVQVGKNKCLDNWIRTQCRKACGLCPSKFKKVIV
mgnify:CR=1 FL=1